MPIAPTATTLAVSSLTPPIIPLSLLFFFSGAIALVYEALWQRRFALVFGSAAPATAAVLAAYFAGLALGSFLIGNRVHKFNSPLKTYALLEVGIALGAICVEPLLRLFDILQPTAASSSSALLLLRTILAFIALALPTICMGGTFPVLGAFIDRGEHHLGRTAGLLYVINTAGAALGVLSVPLFFLRYLGSNKTLLLCIAGNLLIAIIAYRLEGRATARPARASARAASKPEPSTTPSRSHAPIAAEQFPLSPRERAGVRAPASTPTRANATSSPASRPQSSANKNPLFLNSLTLSFFSGLIAFVVQILWNRAFAQIHENSLYSFTLIAAIFIAALAIGGQLTRAALRRNYKPETLLAFAWLTAGILLLTSAPLFLSVTHNLTYITSPAGWWQSAAKLAALAALLILPTATLIGIALPAIFERAGSATLPLPLGEGRGEGPAYNPQSHTGKILGQLLTANLLGSTIGALAAGFLLPQWLGLWGTMIFSGALLLAASTKFIPKLKIAFLLIGIPLLAAFSIRNHFPRTRLAADQSEKLIALSEGAHGIVAVTDRANSRRMKLNNAYVLGGTASTGDERMQSHVPLLLHPNPQRVAYMGLGTGISAGGALFHPVQQITILELVPEIAQAARVHFADANLRILDQPQTRLIVEDARNYLRHTREKFDVIIGDLVVPWRAGEGALFTIENFRAGKNALAPGGIYCQWLPMFQLSEDEFRILLNTFLSVFPEAYLWRADFSPNETALALIGFADNTTLNAKTIHDRLTQFKSGATSNGPSNANTGAQASPSPVPGEGRGEGPASTQSDRSLDPTNPQLTTDYALWMNFIGTITRADVNQRWRINSEDRPWVELLGPLSHTGPNSAFTGRRLQNWARELNATSLFRFRAGELESAAMYAGDLLFDFTISESEANQRAAAQAQSELKQLLPPNVYQTIFPQ